ncbi:hypothetical protein [Botrimarina hoheduenensis]|uniref:Uncharacterized protein n=1 Tax=Botrimarina hoheduenensis TaxID=2528000 RepID=A0A5C5VS13_9BACT|nr:hypothetical protein [Botrimarina hoheduenensis]TWT41388.1 hypothetical protein Pla111_31020 [Botrimarina hoheduenensis]
MTNQAAAGYPKPGNSVSLSGPPQAFSHIKKIGSEYNQVSSGEREKAPLRYHAPPLKQHFVAAHEGPRETTGKPDLHAIYTPSGKVIAEIHSKLDQEKLARNRQKDLQMKRWREAAVTTSRRFNAVTIRPVHLRESNTPEVFAKARQAALKKRLQQKHANSRDDRSR